MSGCLRWTGIGLGLGLAGVLGYGAWHSPVMQAILLVVFGGLLVGGPIFVLAIWNARLQAQVMGREARVSNNYKMSAVPQPWLVQSPPAQLPPPQEQWPEWNTIEGQQQDSEVTV